MFLSDLSSLNRVTRPFATDLNLLHTNLIGFTPSSSPPQAMSPTVKYNTGDPEIDRMYNQSPIITEYASTYQNDSTYKVDEKETTKTVEDSGSNTNSPNLSALQGKKSHKHKITFEPRPIVPVIIEKSGLSQALELINQKNKDNKHAGKVKLTIFLPDTEALVLHAPKNCTFGQLIKQILKEHQEREIYPALNYDEPDDYELRIHEGDGEPDRDFAALENDKFLRDFNLGDEYCLCEVFRDDSDFGEFGIGGGGGKGSGKNVSRNTSGADSLFSPSQFGTLPSSRSGGAGGGGGNDTSGKRHGFNLIDDEDNDDDEDDQAYLKKQEYEHNRFIDEDDILYEEDNADGDTGDGSDGLGSGHGHGQGERDYVDIRFPNGQDINLPFLKETTFRDLLPVIAKTHKLRLYTDEYIFVITQQDQKHLKLMSPFIDVDTKISSVGAKVFEIQRKIYADSCAVKKPTKPSGHGHGHHNAHTSKASIDANMSTLNNAAHVSPLVAMMNTFTEATANAYQEWNVVKKNKFGRRQERVFGVDGKKVYNAKRGALRGGNQSGVHRAERDISTIVKIEMLSEDGSVLANGGAVGGGGGVGGVGNVNSTSTHTHNNATLSTNTTAMNTINNNNSTSVLGHHNASNKDLVSLNSNAGGGVANAAGGGGGGVGHDSLGSRTFRITWAESNDIYNIEYTTDTSRECLEIVAKVKYLMNRLKRGGH